MLREKIKTITSKEEKNKNKTNPQTNSKMISFLNIPRVLAMGTSGVDEDDS